MSKKGNVSVVACRFGWVQFKSFFSCVFKKFILSTTVKLTIWVNQFFSCVRGAPKKIC